MHKKILIVGNPMYRMALVGLSEIVYDIDEFMSHPEKYDLILFTGGEDVHPSFYGDESPDGLCSSSLQRDKNEKIIFDHAIKHGIKMTGICRGVQFLNVMSGGKMMHHMEKHGGSHHQLECLYNTELITINSLHHQMMLPSDEGIVIGWAHEKLSPVYYGESDQQVDYTGHEVEAVLYPETQVCGVQWHPEMMDMQTSGHIWYYRLMTDFLRMPMYEFIRTYGEQRKNMHAHQI